MRRAVWKVPIKSFTIWMIIAASKGSAWTARLTTRVSTTKIAQNKSSKSWKARESIVTVRNALEFLSILAWNLTLKECFFLKTLIEVNPFNEELIWANNGALLLASNFIALLSTLRHLWRKKIVRTDMMKIIRASHGIMTEMRQNTASTLKKNKANQVDTTGNTESTTPTSLEKRLSIRPDGFSS